MAGKKDYSNILNKKFGKLLVQEIVYPVDVLEKRARCRCLCECGKETLIITSDIIHGKRKTCGCFRKMHESLVGRKFGRLKILNKTKPEKCPDSSAVYYNCLCDCGVEKIISHSAIERQNQRSCGCLAKELAKTRSQKNSPHWRGCGDISGHHIASLKHNANRRNIEWNLTKEYLWELFEKQKGVCALSGPPLSFPEKYANGTYTASLDRIDSLKPYIEGNVQWVHKHVNCMKLNHT